MHTCRTDETAPCLSYLGLRDKAGLRDRQKPYHDASASGSIHAARDIATERSFYAKERTLDAIKYTLSSMLQGQAGIMHAMASIVDKHALQGWPLLCDKPC